MSLVSEIPLVISIRCAVLSPLCPVDVVLLQAVIVIMSQVLWLHWKGTGRPASLRAHVKGKLWECSFPFQLPLMMLVLVPVSWQ